MPSQVRVQAVGPSLVNVLDMILSLALEDHDVATEEAISRWRGET